MLTLKPLLKLPRNSPRVVLAILATALLAGCGGDDSPEIEAVKALQLPLPPPPPTEPGEWIYDPYRGEYFVHREAVGFGFEVAVINGNLVIVGMSQDGTAYAAGIPPGGVIKAFNGEPMSDPAILAQRVIAAETFTFTVHGPEGTSDYTIERGPFQERVYYKRQAMEGPRPDEAASDETVPAEE